MSSMFDPQQLVDAIEIADSMATKFVVCPQGRYNMQIKEYVSRRIIPDDSSKKPFTTLEVTCAISGTEKDPISGVALKDLTGRDEVLVRYKCFLDFVEGSNALALGPGSNVGLGRLRDAVGQNIPGQPWRFGMLKGQVFNGEVFHVPNKNDPETPYAEVRNPLPRQ